MRFDTFSRWLINGALLCLVAGAASAGVNSWTIQGPPGGEHFSDLEASPTDPNVYYVAYNRVLARSSDGAVTWQNIGSEFTKQVMDIAVDPTDGNRIYVAVYEQGMFRSDNGGASFVQIVPSSDIVWAVGVGGADGRTVYYTANGGTFHRSEDRGATWTQRTSNPQGINRILVDGADGNRIRAAHGDSIKISNDGAVTWTTVALGSTVWDLERVSATLLVAATSAGIYVSNDDAATWSQASGGTFWTVTRDPATPTTLYAGNSGFWELWRSTNSGTTWTPVGVPMLVEPRGLVATSTGTTTRIVAASLQGVVRSTNAGTTWTESSSGPVATSPLLATTLAANSRVYAYTVGNGLFSNSMDNGWQRISLAPWHSATTVFGGTQAALAVTPGQPRSIYLVPFMRAGARSTDGGVTWTSTGPQLANLAVTALGADPLDGRIMYASIYQLVGSPLASLYRSTDSGTTWSPHSVDLGGVYPFQIAVDPANTSRIFLASYQGYGPPNSGGLYRSTDGGLHWTERGFMGMDVRRVAIDPSDSNRMYAATQLGLQVSTDGGNTFTRNNPFAIVSPLPAGAVAVDPVVSSTLYAVATDPGTSFGPQQPSVVARSVDRGQSWEVLRAASVSPPWYAGDIVLDPNLPSLLYVVTGTHGVATFEIQNDLSVAIQGHSGTRPFGVDSNFTVRVQHNGSLAATAARLDLTLPNGLTNVVLTPPAGSTCALTPAPRCDIPVLRAGQAADVTVQYRAPVAMALPVTAQVSAHERDSANTNNSAQASALAGEVVDLRVTVTPAATAVDHGDALTYTVRVTNDGPVAASAATLMFTAGSGITLGAAPASCATAATAFSCALGPLAVGASSELSIAATASGIGTLSADAAVTAAAAASDTNTANNSLSVAVTSRAVADLSVTATDSADPVQTAAGFSYTVAVRNSGPDEMPGVTAAITGAGSATAATSTRGTCTISGANVNCTIGALANGATADITITTSVAAAGTNTLGVTVAGGGTDRTAANNTVQQATVVNAPPAAAPPRSGGGGGGGAIDLLMLLALCLLLFHTRRRRA